MLEARERGAIQIPIGQQGDLGRWAALASQAGDLHAVMAARSEAELAQTRSILRQRLAGGSALSSVMAEALAAVREAVRRASGYRCPEQLLAVGAALHHGFAVEVPDDGRNALVGMFPVFLAAIQSEQAHFVTADAVIARISYDKAKDIFGLLGMRAGLVPEITAPVEDHQRVFGCDVAYGSYLQMACEYLADHLAHSPAELTGCKQQLAVVDQVDAILIDHAADPLIINAARPPDPERFQRIAVAALKLRPGAHYEIADATGRISWTAEGFRQAKQILRADLQSLGAAVTRRRIEDALRATDWYRRGADYRLDGGALAVIDAPGSRLAGNARLSSGVIQAIEAKEGLPASGEVAVLARTTVRDLFRRYERLCGISGQAAHASAELERLYPMNTAAVTAEPSARIDHADVLFEKAESRFEALADDALQRHRAGQPVLIGVASAGDAPLVTRMLAQRGVDGSAMATGDQAAAEVFAQAGRAGAITVLTPAQPHGYDVVVNGERTAPEGEAKPSAGLAVLVAGRSRSWRADQWVRGLAGRCGYPGESRFYLSAQDPLLRGLQSRAREAIPLRIRQRGDRVPAGKMITRLVDRVQRDAAAADFQRLLAGLAFEDVENDQRNAVYSMRDDVLLGRDLSAYVEGLIDQVAAIYVRRYPDTERLLSELADLYPTRLTLADLTVSGDSAAGSLPVTDRKALVKADARRAYRRHEEFIGAATLRNLEREFTLRVLDRNWAQHLLEMESMRTVCNSDPKPDARLEEYQGESARQFRAMLDRVKVHVAGYLFHAKWSPAVGTAGGVGEDAG